MQTNLLWEGKEYYSLENCLVDDTVDGLKACSSIVGYYNDKIYRVEYTVETNKLCETTFVEIKCQHNNIIQHYKFYGDGKGNWTDKGKPLDDFTGCIDVDIPLTPFTNTLPIKRLILPEGETKEINVIYFDLLDESIKAVRQRYTHLANNAYQYQNVPNDFEATIQVDDSGYVVDYPALFIRKAAHTTSY